MSEPELHAEPAPKPDWPSPGRRLKKVREEMGLSHTRVAEALHLTSHYIKALEDDRYDKLPGKTFVKGYFRAYAKLLGVNVDEIMQCYQHYMEALEETEETEACEIRARKTYDQNLRWMICAAVIIVVVVGLSWWLSRSGDTDAALAQGNTIVVAEVETGQEESVTAEELMATLEGTPEQEAETATPDVDEPVMENSVVLSDAAADLADDVAEAGIERAVAPAAEAEAAPGDAGAAGLAGTDPLAQELPEYVILESGDSRQVQLESEGEDLLEVRFSGYSWIEVDNGDNTRLYHDMLGNGDDLTIRGKAPFNILVGDANMVDMTFNSREVDVSSRMRNDNSARIILEPETR